MGASHELTRFDEGWLGPAETKRHRPWIMVRRWAVLLALLPALTLTSAASGAPDDCPFSDPNYPGGRWEFPFVEHPAPSVTVSVSWPLGGFGLPPGTPIWIDWGDGGTDVIETFPCNDGSALWFAMGSRAHTYTSPDGGTFISALRWGTGHSPPGFQGRVTLLPTGPPQPPPPPPPPAPAPASPPPAPPPPGSVIVAGIRQLPGDCQLLHEIADIDPTWKARQVASPIIDPDALDAAIQRVAVTTPSSAAGEAVRSLLLASYRSLQANEARYDTTYKAAVAAARLAARRLGSGGSADVSDFFAPAAARELAALRRKALQDLDALARVLPSRLDAALRSCVQAQVQAGVPAIGEPPTIDKRVALSLYREKMKAAERGVAWNSVICLPESAVSVGGALGKGIKQALTEAAKEVAKGLAGGASGVPTGVCEAALRGASALDAQAANVDYRAALDPPDPDYQVLAPALPRTQVRVARGRHPTALARRWDELMRNLGDQASLQHATVTAIERAQAAGIAGSGAAMTPQLRLAASSSERLARRLDDEPRLRQAVVKALKRRGVRVRLTTSRQRRVLQAATLLAEVRPEQMDAPNHRLAKALQRGFVSTDWERSVPLRFPEDLADPELLRTVRAGAGAAHAVAQALRTAWR